MDKCFCHLNGYEVKDAKARNDLANLYVNSVAELKTLTTLKDGDVVRTLGYYEANDGGSALYSIRTRLETDVEDSGLTHFLRNSLVAKLLIENDTINVKQMGAKGDGITDITTLFQSIIDLCCLKGYKMYIPIGKYLVTNTLYIKSRITIEGVTIPQMWSGNSYDSRIIANLDYSVNYKPVFCVSNDWAFNWSTAKNNIIENVNISNLRILNDTTRQACAIYCTTAMSNFKNIFISNFMCGIACPGSYVTNFDNIMIMNTQQCIVNYNNGPLVNFKNIWTQYGANIPAGSVIEDEKYKSTFDIITDWRYCSVYNRFGKLHLDNFALEGHCVGIISDDGEVYGNYVSIESITDVALFSKTTNFPSLIKINKIGGMYNPTGFDSYIAKVSYLSGIDITFMDEFPTTGWSLGYDLSSHTWAKVKSMIEGERIIPLTLSSNVVNPVIENKSYYTTKGFHIDMLIDGFESIDNSIVTTIEGLPNTNASLFNGIKGVVCSVGDEFKHLKVSKNKGLINQDGSYIDSSISTGIIHIVGDYTIAN